MNLYFNLWVPIISESLIIQITEWLFNSIELHSRLTAVHLVWFAFRFDLIIFCLFKKYSVYCYVYMYTLIVAIKSISLVILLFHQLLGRCISDPTHLRLFFFTYSDEASRPAFFVLLSSRMASFAPEITHKVYSFKHCLPHYIYPFLR